MQSRLYADLFTLVEALCGVTFSSNETGRINALINRRATRAYRATYFWPRFLVIGEERACSSGVVPWTESSLGDIGTFLSIHRTVPFIGQSAQMLEFSVESSGARLVAGDLDPTSVFVTYQQAKAESYGDGAGQTTTIPNEWFEYIAHGTYADFLRAEGQQEKSALADAEAQDILTDELMRVDTMTPAWLVSKIATNLNHQTR